MLDLVLIRQQSLTTKSILQRSQLKWLLWYLGVLGIAGFIAALMVRGGPTFSWLAWLLLIVSAILILLQPRYGIYLTIFWTLAGDQAIMPWYPFSKNFSSRETLLFLNDAVIFSPLELFLVLTFISWLLKDAGRRRFRIFTGPLFWPLMLFGAFLGFGLVYGISRGGDVNIALWESRAMFYMVMIVILISNLFEKRDHIKAVVWVILTGLLAKSLYATYHLLVVLQADLSMTDSLTEHLAAIQLSFLLVLAAATWLYQVSWKKRLVLLTILPIFLLTIVGAQRRSAYAALIIAFVLLAIVLFIERRTAFFLIVPPIAIIGLAYMGAFWNNTSPLGGPAQAVKSIVAEDEAEAHDRASNDYRKIENFNTNFTIRLRPLTGVGFGNKFYIVIPLPDISFFTWWEYIPHNSVIYIWMKSGVGGFMALLLLVGLSIAHGARVVRRLTSPFLKAIALSATIYIVMHFIYAYVDFSWDAQGMVMLGAILGILNCIEPIVKVDLPKTERRWPWQPEPSKPAPLLPLPTD